ncbi:MAG: DNA alkylation repair protein [Eubacterium sp.]|nr:DNA alkylation repair protein [Eubacterium sp.]
MSIDKETLRARLDVLADEQYRAFSEKIVHTSGKPLIGVRTPELKKIAKEYAADYKDIFELPADTYEEMLLKGLTLGMAKAPLAEKLPYILGYAEMIDNWALCDLFCSALKMKKDEYGALSEFIDEIILSPDEYVSRTGIVLMFSNFKAESDARRAFAIYDKITAGRYYVDMAVAWGISVYCVYHPQLTVQYLRNSPISADIKKKAAQKIRDSRRVSQEVKDKVTAVAK